MSGNVFIVTGELPRYFRFANGGSPSTSTTTVQASNATYKEGVFSTFQGIVTGTGAQTATIVIQASNEDLTFAGTNSNWVTLGTITLSGTTSATDGFATTAAWKYVRANVTALTGTGATVQVIMGN